MAYSRIYITSLILFSFFSIFSQEKTIIDTSFSTNFRVNENDKVIYNYDNLGRSISFTQFKGCGYSIDSHDKGGVHNLMESALSDALIIRTSQNQNHSQIAAVIETTNLPQLHTVFFQNESLTPNFSNATINFGGNIYDMAIIGDNKYLILSYRTLSVYDRNGNKLTSKYSPTNYAYIRHQPNSNYLFLYVPDRKTIELRNEKLDYVQSFDPLFPSIDGFELFNSLIFFWRGKTLYRFSLIDSSNKVIDDNFSPENIYITSNSIVWYSNNAPNELNTTTYEDGNYNSKTITLLPISKKGKTRLVHLDDSTTVYTEQSHVKANGQDISEFVYTKSKYGNSDHLNLNVEVLESSLMPIDSSWINNSWSYKVRLSIEVKNIGQKKITSYAITSLEYATNAGCKMPIVNKVIDDLELSPSQTIKTKVVLENLSKKDLCFYLTALNGGLDMDPEDNFICFQDYVLPSKNEEVEFVTLYPNPASQYILTKGLSKSFLIVDLNGVIIKEVLNGERVDISNLKNGIYFIRDQKGKSLRFIKI